MLEKIDCDLAIVGSGFGGTLLALIARQLGLRVVLLERGTHPRFAIGESSTPLADFKLARIADHFGLDWLRPFAKYGSWKATNPDVVCGLKRGFSFFRHERGQAFDWSAANANALLVAASPDDAAADTHWFRADFDAHLVGRAQAADVAFFDRTQIQSLRHHDPGWRLEAVQGEKCLAIQTEFLVDATGDGQLLGQALDLKPMASAKLQVRSRSLYSHFTNVSRWHDVLEETHGRRSTAEHPFACDAAALHQIIDHGWMWVLRFDNGITSAGFSLDLDAHPLDENETPETEWRRLLDSYPSLARQFARAEPVRPFTRTGRLQRRLARAAGENWALLPHAAGFLDAWLSPGIAQTLYAVNRLGRILEENASPKRRPKRLTEYGQTVLCELEWVDEITATCFACFDRFEVLATVTMLYFAAAIHCEERERAGLSGPDDAFLLADHAGYRDLARSAFLEARRTPAHDAARFAESVRGALTPFKLGCLFDPPSHNMVPFIGGPTNELRP